MMAIALLIPGTLPTGMERSPSKGLFLVADPRLTDPNFRESVVLLTRHGEEGSVGLIINRPTALSISEVLPDLRAEGAPSGVLFAGGPVSRNGLSLLLQAERPPRGVEAVMGNLYFGVNVRETIGLLKKTERFRVYAGYAGWAPGQLEAEIGRGDWHLLPGDPVLLFEKDPDAVWAELLRRSRRQLVRLPVSLSVFKSSEVIR